MCEAKILYDRRVPVSDMYRVRNYTDIYDYIELNHFLK